MRYRMILLTFLITIANIVPLSAQMAAQKDAIYFATIKAVADYKIGDEENIKQIENLRNDTKFNEKLQKMMEKVSNTKSKDNKNQKIYNILRQAGKQIYDELS